MLFIAYFGNLKDINNGFDIFIRMTSDITDEFINNYKNKLWFSIQDKEQLNNYTDIKYIENFNICLLPENNKDLILNKYDGICSKYISYYKQMFNAKKRYALIINGRLKCYEIKLIPDIIKFLEENEDSWIDIHINLNEKKENLNNYLNLPYIDYPFIATIDCNEYITNEYMQNHPTRLKHLLHHIYISSMFYTTMKAFYQLKWFSKNNNIKYDLIIKYRSDIIENNKLPDLSNIEDNILYMPLCQRYVEVNFLEPVNDQVAIGTYDIMKKYCMVYPNIDIYLKNNDMLYHPETILSYHLKYNNIIIKPLNFHYILGPRR